MYIYMQTHTHTHTHTHVHIYADTQMSTFENLCLQRSFLLPLVGSLLTRCTSTLDPSCVYFFLRDFFYLSL
jgi:hypothetical protein